MASKLKGDRINIGIGTSDPISNLEVGDVHYRSDTGNMRVYTGGGADEGWKNVNIKVPEITSATGNIIEDIGGTLSITGVDFGTEQGTMTFVNGLDTYDVNVLPTNSTSISVSVPSGIYSNVNPGSNYQLVFQNSDGGISKQFDAPNIIALPTGGSKSSFGNYNVHAFTGSGTFSTQLSLSVDVLVVGGGGGGATSNGGGGGAGGLVYRSSFPISAGSYSIVVGAGASGGPRDPFGGGIRYASYPSGGRGNNSTAFGLIAIGGGNGGGDDYWGVDGGSGGGGADDGANAGPGATVQTSQGTSVGGFGNNGGDGRAGGNGFAGAGGGGAGSAGSNNNTNNRNGGNGRYYGDIFGNGYGASGYFAGGGGGGAKNGGDSYSSNGGSGIHGGGNGASSGGGGGGNAQANTGSGGGGGSAGGGGSGGSGIVLIRYDRTNL